MKNSIRKEIATHVYQMTKLSEELNALERSFLDKFDEGDDDAGLFMDRGIENAKRHFHEIGLRLYALGGIELMHYCLHQIPNEGQSQWSISADWVGIGEWKDMFFDAFRKDLKKI